jgi:acetyl-CoA synthetase
MREGDEWVKKTSRKSAAPARLGGRADQSRGLGMVWRVVGEERCPIVDTWWQTETGGHDHPAARRHRPEARLGRLPMFGVVPQMVDAEGKVLEGATEGNLCITQSWPGQMRTVWGDHERFFQTYFTTYRGKYFTGDGCRRDEDGYYWITGRVDDVINVSGHRMGTAEVESALVAHAKVAEAAVVGMPHEIKGQGIYAYVTLNANERRATEVRKELVQWVRQEIGPIATPDVIHFAPALPKTRSGKIMRRILRKIAEGDTRTLAIPARWPIPAMATHFEGVWPNAPILNEAERTPKSLCRFIRFQHGQPNLCGTSRSGPAFDRRVN